jgi:Zn-finger nucleic acid-binding protein
MDCPKCLGKLNEVEIRFHEIKDMPKQKEAMISTLTVDQCFVCNGVWFDAGEIEKYIEKKLTIVDSPMIDLDTMLDLDKKIVKCPRCNIDMVKNQRLYLKI